MSEQEIKNQIYNFKTIDIKGKNYVMINERLRFFKEQHPNWTIYTEIIERTPEEVLMRAIIKDESGAFKAEGLAFETRSSSMVNKTSYIENCQTSAVGRALGFLGIGITESIATAEEVINAISAQDGLKTLKPKTDAPSLMAQIDHCLRQLQDKDFTNKVTAYLVTKKDDPLALATTLNRCQARLKDLKGDFKN